MYYFIICFRNNGVSFKENNNLFSLIYLLYGRDGFIFRFV